MPYRVRLAIQLLVRHEAARTLRIRRACQRNSHKQQHFTEILLEKTVFYKHKLAACQCAASKERSLCAASKELGDHAWNSPVVLGQQWQQLLDVHEALKPTSQYNYVSSHAAAYHVCELRQLGLELLSLLRLDLLGRGGWGLHWERTVVGG